MKAIKKELIEALNENIRELQQCINAHCCLVESILESQSDGGKNHEVLKICPQHSSEMRLKEAVKDTINVLEESRRAFKSKQLESLRKRLTQTLIDVK